MDKRTEAEVAEELVTKIIQGDALAEKAMIERYQRGVSAMLFNRCRDHDLAQEIMQDTWVLIIEKVRADTLNDRTKLAAYIVQTAKNQLIMYYRKDTSDKHVDFDLVVKFKDGHGEPSQDISAQQKADAIMQTLENMSVQRDSEILKRALLFGDTKKELCEAFGLSEAHFDRVLYRARQRFRELWAKRQQAYD